MDFAPHKLECADLRKNFSGVETIGRMLDTLQPTRAKDRMKLRSCHEWKRTMPSPTQCAPPASTRRLPISTPNEAGIPCSALPRFALAPGRHCLGCYGLAARKDRALTPRFGSRIGNGDFHDPVASGASDSHVRIGAIRRKQGSRMRTVATAPVR